jgi:hypothetical protein
MMELLNEGKKKLGAIKEAESRKIWVRLQKRKKVTHLASDQLGMERYQLGI